MEEWLEKEEEENRGKRNGGGKKREISNHRRYLCETEWTDPEDPVAFKILWQKFNFLKDILKIGKVII